MKTKRMNQEEQDHFENLPKEVFHLILNKCGAFWWVPKLVSVKWSEEARVVWCHEMIHSVANINSLALFQKDIIQKCLMLERSVPTWEFYKLVERMRDKSIWLEEKGEKIPPQKLDCQLKHVYYIKPELHRRVIIPLMKGNPRLIPIKPDTIITGETRISEVSLFNTKIDCVRMVDLAFRDHTPLVICGRDEFPKTSHQIPKAAKFAYVGENWNDSDCLDYFNRVPDWYARGNDFLRNIENAMNLQKILATEKWMTFCVDSLKENPEFESLKKFGLFPNLLTKVSGPTTNKIYYLSMVTTSEIASRFSLGKYFTSFTCSVYFKRDQTRKKILCSSFQCLFSPEIVSISDILQPMLIEMKVKPSQMNHLFKVIHETLS